MDKKTPPKSRKVPPHVKVFEFISGIYGFIKTLCVKSNIHGVKYIFNSKFHFIERIFWLSLVIVASYGAYFISSQQYGRYVANPTVISLERDYRDWNGTLPSITVCYHKRVDETKAEAVIKKFWNIEKVDPEYNYFLDYVRSVVNVNETFTKFNRFANDKRLEFINMLVIAKEVHPKINTIISSFDTNAEFILDEIITEKGVCYCVNSILAPLISTDQSIDAIKKLNLNTRPLSCYFLKNQCYMKLDVYDPTVSVAIHSSFEIPTESMHFFDMGMTDEIESTYNMLETVSSDALRKLTIRQRKCLFSDESITELPVYSYNACNLVCRANAAIKSCGCRPYFYPFMNGTICSPAGLFCLGLNKWQQNANANACGCSKTCAEIVYTQNSLKKINWAVDGGIPFTQKSSFRNEILAPRLRLRRDVLFSYEDLIVSFGGVVSLFLGYNFWANSEMFYYIIQLIIKFLYEKISQYY